ncbi:polysaccharide biosynthesis/export family protein [Leptolyngbya sp. 7M]|uniref:polysaccharide biosynthesis/export family protein n=1 Tax=Leptolyngbya sp. 7M TaxID=2812896 RepID=UPI001B8BA119|nr:SLBB domain-containing protein [Leptolyngbya sp. 7M]QYO63011.1 SLBB domain-containing protein [Leptolyngbya sp. 7M]
MGSLRPEPNRRKRSPSLRRSAGRRSTSKGASGASGALSGALGFTSTLSEVDVIGSTEFDWRGELTPEGFLDGLDELPKPIFALCRSPEDVSKEIEVGYSRILRDPRVSVRIIDRSNRAVAVLDGAVRTPHRFRIQRRVSLVELLVSAGGLTDAAGGEIRIQRPRDLSCRERREATSDGESRPNVTIIKITDLLNGLPEANPIIVSGDIITVLEAYPIYVIGGVMRPGKIDSRSKVTLSRAISMSGGFSRSADKESIAIIRKEGGAGEILEVSLAKIENGEVDDPILKPFDIVDVREKGKPPKRPISDPEQISRRVGTGVSEYALKIID